ncbi:hypothetical protein EP342_00030 [bacterium]|nr:MAG: hypothetical protein EP342_00030 [bacterium]
MLFISTSTFPFFGEMLSRANIQIYELNEEENNSHNSKVKGKFGSYTAYLESQKSLIEYSTTLSTIIYLLKRYTNYFPEVNTPPPELSFII